MKDVKVENIPLREPIFHFYIFGAASSNYFLPQNSVNTRLVDFG